MPFLPLIQIESMKRDRELLIEDQARFLVIIGDGYGARINRMPRVLMYKLM